MRAIKTTISKTYIGDVGTMGTGCFSVMGELIFTLIIIGFLLYFRSGW